MPYDASPLLRFIRRLAPPYTMRETSREASDGHLLDRFVAAKDEGAFEGLMHRHGPMVLAVCQRVLSSPHDVEDAFQATFLVLVQKADSIRKQESIASWLFGVANKVAARLREKAANRRLHHGPLVETIPADAARPERDETAWKIHEALDCLPPKFRAPLVLYYLEGKTQDETAKELGWTAGMVKGRLERGRYKLRARLAKTGITLSATALPAALTDQATAGLVPAALVHSTLQVSLLGTAGKTATTGVVPAQVLALIKEVTKAMFLTKLQIVTVTILAVGIIAAGVAAVTYVAGHGGDDPAVVRTAKNAPAGDDNASRTDQEKIQGTWIIVSRKVWDDKGKEIKGEGPEAEKIAEHIKQKKLKLIFTGEKLTLSGGDEMPSFNYKLDPSKKPRTIDSISDKETHKGIYSLNGKELKLCFAGNEHQRSFNPAKEGIIPGARPMDFTNPPGAELWVCEYEGPDK
jgi:RNA polymerase sigma factor (sigma-70 family)